VTTVTDETLPAPRLADRYRIPHPKALFRKAKRGLKWLPVLAAARSRTAAGVYYLALKRALNNEARATAAGRARYRADHKSEAQTYFLLRRNVHRLEKGLIMRPRRPSFAADYIGDTVSIFERAARNIRLEDGPNNEVRWALAVLAEYFSVVDLGVPKIAAAHQRFQSVAGRIGLPAEAMTPYRRDLMEEPPVSFEKFQALCHRRRSVRWYLDKPVPAELVDLAVTAAAQSPSACNRQPFNFRVFLEPERARRIGAIPLGTKGFSDKLPAIAVLVGRLRAYPLERDRHAIYVDGALAAMSFMFALETLGLSSCPINWPDSEPQESIMARELGLEADERVIMLIALGWPDPTGAVPFSAKRDLDQLRTFG
jgi:nitroreductase